MSEFWLEIAGQQGVKVYFSLLLKAILKMSSNS